MTQKEQTRYRAITRQLARLRANGWTEETHPDFEFLEAELNKLAEKLIASA